MTELTFTIFVVITTGKSEMMENSKQQEKQINYRFFDIIKTAMRGIT